MSISNIGYLAQAVDLSPDHGIPKGGSGESWDLLSFMSNSTNYGATLGGAFLAFMGLCGLVWGFVRVMMKLFGGQSGQQIQWVPTIILIIIGGAFLFGGIGLALNFASGAGDTVTGFGTGG